ncbi:MAG TPA: hypothetical protein VFT55_15250, partial [Planctomycetota bacterium]|nr:hypothetical protein [Planctomycetota bacterium]
MRTRWPIFGLAVPLGPSLSAIRRRFVRAGRPLATPTLAARVAIESLGAFAAHVAARNFRPRALRVRARLGALAVLGARRTIHAVGTTGSLTSVALRGMAFGP